MLTILRLTESDIYGIIHESVKQILWESQESKSISQAKRLVMARLGYDETQADEFVRITLRNDIPSLRTPEGGKFILGVTRMFCDGELRNAHDIGAINATLKLVASEAHINEYDRNLNGLSARELIQRFSKAMSDNLEQERNDVNSMEFTTPSDYEIVRIDSFEQASQYAQYTTWCVTHHEHMFDSYTSDGINQFYFCLKHGFENVPAEPGDNAPLDEYGLSMIAVCVNEDGMLSTCTCRWNHDNGGDDSVMDAKQVSQVIGMNFFEVFKPNGLLKEKLRDAIEKLKAGTDPLFIFDSAHAYHDGYTKVELCGKLNMLTPQGNLLSEQWFDDMYQFHEGASMVMLGNKWNYINQEGNIISQKWFGDVDSFNEGLGLVELNDEYNYIDINGNIVFNRWFDGACSFSEGMAVIRDNGKWNFINHQGKILSKQWFDHTGFFSEGIAFVQIHGKVNFINKQGHLVSQQWFDYAQNAQYGFAVIGVGNKWNYMRPNGEILSRQWFDNAKPFTSDGWAKVTLDGKEFAIDRNGTPILDEKQLRKIYY